MKVGSLQALLLRFPAGTSARLAASRSSLRAPDTKFALEPLFTTVPAGPEGYGLAATGHREWCIARPGHDVEKPWEAAYEALARAAQDTGARPDIVEPDVWQEWVYLPRRSVPAGV